MSNAAIAETVLPPNPLEKAKNGEGPVSIDPSVLQRAEEAVEKLSEDYSSFAQADIYTRALDLKGQGGGFGYDLITAIGDLLTKFLEGKVDLSPRDFDIFNAHVDAMQVVPRAEMKGGGHKIGVPIVDGLSQLVLKDKSHFSTALDGSRRERAGGAVYDRNMTVHLIKLAVGIDSFSHLLERQAFRLAEAAGTDEPRLRHLTRSTPRRAEEILDGGSIYWVIKRAIRARQRIVDLDSAVNHKGVPRCALILDPELLPVRARPCRPFQGWRYLEQKDAPLDAVGIRDHADELPPEMAEKLRELGLL